MTGRTESKEASFHRIVAAAAARIRTEGVQGATIGPVMQDAGLTHGAFYCHFTDKDALTIAALREALRENRPRWMGRADRESWSERLRRLGRRYLTKAHRDDPADGCALAALASDAGRSQPAFKRAYEEELRASLRAICETSADATPDSARFDQAIAFMAQCLGGILLARAVSDTGFSDRILTVCREAAARIPGDED